MERLLFTLSILLCITPAVADFELPLTTTESQGSGGTKYISNGVPLLPGQAQHVSELRVLGPGGEPVPCQFRVLSRWWRKDNSIRWVLADFIGSVPSQGSRVYRLVGSTKPPAAPGTPLKLAEDPDFFTIDTGPARFKVSKKAFNFIHELRIDADADGTFADGETVVFPDATLGSVVEDPQGRKYFSAPGTRFVKVIDKGPVRITLLAKGVHVSNEDGAFKPSLYGYEVFLTFHADRPSVDVDAILTNNFKDPIGEPRSGNARFVPFPLTLARPRPKLILPHGHTHTRGDTLEKRPSSASHSDGSRCIGGRRGSHLPRPHANDRRRAGHGQRAERVLGLDRARARQGHSDQPEHGRSLRSRYRHLE